jgi:hypothetical protein
VNVSTDSSVVVLLWNSPSGKLVQIEHALTAVGSGQTSLGIKGIWICLSPFILHCSFFFYLEWFLFE